MNQTSQANDSGGDAAQEHSAGGLVKQMAEQVSTLVRDELKLAQVEMTRKGKQAGREKVQARAARAKETAPGQARHARDSSARAARQQRGPLAAAAGALAAALAVLIIWKRGKRS